MTSRRDFLVRAGALGGAFVTGAPAMDILSRAVAGGAAPGVLLSSTDGEPSASPVTALASGLHWRMLGPFRGGRVAAATGVPGRPNEFYFGAVNGGVWKSIDGGRVWVPIFDAQPVASIGAIAVAPSQPDTIYVGSGESTLRDSAGYGNGVYRSTDAGKTWTHLGLDETHHIGKIAVDPRNPEIVFVAAIGKLYAPNAERGVFRSTDGGRSWTRVLSRNDDVGAVEVVIDPSDSRVVYAGLWNTRRPPWFTYAPTNGPGGGIYKSVDGGTTWTQLTTGLPTTGIGRTGIAIAASDPRRLYAVVDCLLPDPTAPPTTPAAPGRRAPQPAMLGGVFRSDDAGATWTRLSSDPALWGRGWYFSKVTVDPANADIVYVPNVAVNRSLDGGRHWEVLRGSPGGDDYHQAWVSPDDPRTMIVASDQGAIITRNATDDPRLVTWSSWLNQPTAQMYHIATDYRVPYWVTGAQQDSGAVAVRSRGKFAEISIRDWEPIGAGGESGYTAGDPRHPGVIYGGTGQRYDLATNTPIAGTTAPKGGEKDRADWTQPLVVSKADPRKVYYASQFVFRTIDGARSWKQISPDLTRLTETIPPTLDEAAAAQVDRNGKRGVVYTIAPSPRDASTLWVGTDDGLIHLSTDDGLHWSNVTPAAIGPWSRVTMLEASHFDSSTAYASVDRHQLQDFEPYIYRTRDRGRSWQRITRGLPNGVYVHTVKEDPIRRGLLVAGTERGAFISLDDGDTWESLQLDLPVTSVRDFVFAENDLVVGTHGRGIWMVDDIAPLRQWGDAVLGATVHLFKPSDIVGYVPGGDNGTPLQKDEPHAENPPAGAAIDYWLKTDAIGPVTIEIVDSGGTVVGMFSSDPARQPTPRAGGGASAPNGLPSVSPLWIAPPAAVLTSAGLHRVRWDPYTPPKRAVDPGEEAPRGTLRTGNFAARLTVGSTVQSQRFAVHAATATPQ